MYVCLNDFPLYFNIDGMSERLVLLISILALLLNLQPVTQLLPLRGLNKNILDYENSFYHNLFCRVTISQTPKILPDCL